MVLEVTMICIDNSEWMRNGDYSPTRFQAQSDAVNLVCGAKTESNPENTVGVLTMAGKRVRVLVPPTSDLVKILACMHGLEIGSEINLTAGIQVAQLALKHRQNKMQQQRIIVFAGSPIRCDKKMLEELGRKLKKNSVALDVIDFGETDDGKPEKLEALVAAVNNNDNSHIVHVPPGPNVLSDVLISTPIFTGDGDGGSGFAAAVAGGTSGFDFGVDPNNDPELALALRVSMEEERARQEAAAKKDAEDAAKQEKGGEQASSSRDATMAEPVSNSAVAVDDKRSDLTDDETALLETALGMSDDAWSSVVDMADTDMPDVTTEYQELVFALQMSMQESAKDSSTQSETSKLPGIDPNDPSVKDLLASSQGQTEVDHAILEEIREINQYLKHTTVSVEDKDADRVAAAAEPYGTVIKYSLNAFPLNPNLRSLYPSAQISPIWSLRLLIPPDYPNGSPIILDSLPLQPSEEPEDPCSKARSIFSVSLCDLPKPVTLGQMARLWEISAQKVILELFCSSEKNYPTA